MGSRLSEASPAKNARHATTLKTRPAGGEHVRLRLAARGLLYENVAARIKDWTPRDPYPVQAMDRCYDFFAWRDPDSPVAQLGSQMRMMDLEE